MKRTLAAVVTAAALAVGGGVWTGMGSASAGDGSLRGWPVKGSAAAGERFAADKGGSGGRTLAIYTRDLRGQFIDVGRRGESAGDYFVFETTAEKASGKRVGTGSIRCMIMVRTFRCDGTIRLWGEGKLELAGSIFTGRDNRFSVTGGTGRFAGVGGVGRLFEDQGATRSLLVFRLVH